MTHHPLAGVIHKLRNADFHMHRLKAAILPYLDDGSNVTIIPEADADNSGRGRFRFKVIRHPPLEFSAIAGDAIHNLRSSLDYIIHALVRDNGKVPSFQNLYPICKDTDAFAAALKQGRLYGLSERAVRGIDGFQPYQVSPQKRAMHPLMQLHKLSNHDKHHMLALSSHNASFVWKFVDASNRILGSGKTTEPVRDGGILAELPTEFVIDGIKVQLQLKLTISIGFDEPACSEFDILGCLQCIREYIGKFVVPAFGTFFDPLPEELVLTSHGLPDIPCFPDAL